ncbi:hypothetical protein STEG23_022882, partial [Scotinomys teguina]
IDEDLLNPAADPSGLGLFYLEDFIYYSFNPICHGQLSFGYELLILHESVCLL